MKKLKTNYMGIELENPIILGASNMSTDLDTLKRAEAQGAAAIVYKSLFEEQIQLERFQFDEQLTEFNDIYAEMVSIHPNMHHAGPDEHLMKLRSVKEALSIPVIASLNAIDSDTWLEYARLIAETGIDGIELNFFHIPSDFDKTANEIEDRQISIVREVRKNVTVPVSVKLSEDYTNALHFIKKLDEAGVDAVVLFNSFFQPDIDIKNEKHLKSFNLSNKGDYRKSLRYAGLLYGNIKADICSSHGVFTGADVIKLVLSGATCVQVVSAVYKNGLQQIFLMKKELSDWMDSKNYNSIDEFWGKLSKKNLGNDPFVYKRAQYVDLLIHSDEIFASKP
jgi:dihydroorotate dehydrogenase (fumarate)